MGRTRTQWDFTKMVALRRDDSELVPSDNSVQLEDQLMKAADVRRAFDLNTAIVKAFHQMMLQTTKV